MNKNNLIIKEAEIIFNADARAKNRLQQNVFLRHALSYYFRNKMYYTFKSIGDILGKNHASIMHSCKQHLNLYETDKGYKLKYDELKNIFIDKPILTICNNCGYEIKRISSKKNKQSNGLLC